MNSGYELEAECSYRLQRGNYCPGSGVGVTIYVFGTLTIRLQCIYVGRAGTIA